MKKLVTLLLTALLSLSLVGCSTSDKEDTTVENPVTDYDSLEALLEVMPSSMIYEVKDATDESYSSTKDGEDVLYIEYDYTLEDENYMVRFSDDFNQSMSGIAYKEGYAFDDSDAEDYQEFNIVKTDECYVAHWLTTDGTYIFVAFDNTKMTEKEFKAEAQDYQSGTIRADS